MKLTVKTGLGLVLGVLVVAVGTIVVANVFFSQRDVPVAEVEAIWQERSPEYMTVLAEEFPQAYDTLMTQSRTIMIETPDVPAQDAALNAALSGISRDLSETYSDLARQAPDPALREWIGAVAASIQKVYLEGNARLCASFLDFGPNALEESDILPVLRPVLDARDAALYGALAAARDSGLEPVAPAGEDDWAALDVEMSRDDVPASYAEALVEGDSTNEDYCPALVLLFNKIQVLSGDAGQRIRAEYLANSFN